MVRERKKQSGRLLLRKLSRKIDEPQALVRILEEHVKTEGSHEEIQEALAQSFLAVRDMAKEQSSSSLPFSHLVNAFHELAQRKGVESDQFYPYLLERMFRKEETEDFSYSSAKLSTRSKILEASLDLFSEKGFYSTTVDEIAERARVGKGTFYRYFTNKETAFNELIRLRLEDLEKRAQAVLNGQDDVLTMITKYLRIYFEFFDHNQRLYRLIVQEQLDVGDQVKDLYIQKVMRRIPLLKRKIYEATQQGVLKEVDFQTVFYGVMGFIHGVIQKWLAHDCSYSLVQELPTVKEVLFHGFVQTHHSMTSLGGKNEYARNAKQSYRDHHKPVGSGEGNRHS